MNKMKKMFKRFVHWYFNEYINFYKPMIDAGVPMFM